MTEQWLNAKVKVVQLRKAGRESAGTMGVAQDPAVGDIGKVIYEYPPPDKRVTVERSDESGTIWFADFDRDELELLPENE